jgi:hypothetical protein
MWAKMDGLRENKELTRCLRTVSAAMGFLGAINTIAIGFYLLSTIFNPPNF